MLRRNEDDGGGSDVADVLGRRGVYRDPVWRITVTLSPLERELLVSWWVRRLRFVSHAGPASYATVQSYSRLEHSLGLFSLTAYFSPDDPVARAAALLHDVGHLPFSHTFEGVAGLDHHVIGRDRITGDLGTILRAHSVDPLNVADVAAGQLPSVLAGRPGLLKLDHLDSMMRSGSAHGRTRETPRETLAKLEIVDGAVTTDEVTARYLADLVAGEARWVCSAINVASTGVVRHLATRLLEGMQEQGHHDVAEMADDEFWALLLADPQSREAATALRRNPLWEVRSPSKASDPGIRYTVPRLYVDMPLVEGRVCPSLGDTIVDLPALPWTRVVVPPPGVHL